VGKPNAPVDFLLAWKKMEELEPPGLVVTGNNAVHFTVNRLSNNNFYS
jgi:hypothetical protein